jgi:hypothetical protein
VSQKCKERHPAILMVAKLSPRSRDPQNCGVARRALMLDMTKFISTPSSENRKTEPSPPQTRTLDITQPNQAPRSRIAPNRSKRDLVRRERKQSSLNDTHKRAWSGAMWTYICHLKNYKNKKKPSHKRSPVSQALADMDYHSWVYRQGSNMASAPK